jgi:C4-dicarboxylate-specific signal transduction histidine kinase
LNDSPASLKYLEQSHNAVVEAGEQNINLRQIGIKRNIYKLYSEIYESADDHMKALEYYKLYTILKDTLHYFQQRSAQEEFLARFNIRLKEEENEILKRDISIQRLQLKQKNLTNWLLVLSLGMVIIVLGIIIYRFHLKRKLNEKLQEEVRKSIEKHKLQQEIIVHQSSLASLGQMAAGIAHEVNQPLQNIALATDNINMDNKSLSSEKSIGNMVAHIKSDLGMIRKIMDHVRMFSSRQKEEISEKFSINESIRNAYSMMGKQFENHRIRTEFKLSENMDDLKGNPYKFEQVVVNLLNNARDAVESKAKAKTEDKAYVKKIWISTWQEDNNIIMEINDNGIGIPDSDRTNIFLPFFTSKPPGEGMGLGLSITYGIIQEMNGTINVNVKDGEVTSFKISIPKAV